MALPGVLVSDVITAVEQEIGEVSGPGVQVYTEDTLLIKIQQCFRLLMRKYPWEQYRAWSRHQLDGTLGIVNADTFTTVRDFSDFIAVHVDARCEPLPSLPHNMNPYSIATGGTKPIIWTSLPVTDTKFLTRRLQFYPKAATGYVNVLTKIYPDASEIVPATTLYLDKDLLVYGTSWMMLEDEGINQASAGKNQMLFDLTYKDITAALASQPLIGADGRGGGGVNIPTEWR